MIIETKGNTVNIKVSSSEDFVEGIYDIIKKGYQTKELSIDGLETIVELVSELVNRVKEEEGCGK